MRTATVYASTPLVMDKMIDPSLMLFKTGSEFSRNAGQNTFNRISERSIEIKREPE